MRWTILILNLLAVVALQFLAAYATAAHRTHSYSVYRELVANHALAEKPTWQATRRGGTDSHPRIRGLLLVARSHCFSRLHFQRPYLFLFTHTTTQ